MPAMPTARIQNCQRASRSLHTRRSSTMGMSWYEAPMMLSVIHPSVTVWVRADNVRVIVVPGELGGERRHGSAGQDEGRRGGHEIGQGQRRRR